MAQETHTAADDLAFPHVKKMDDQSFESEYLLHVAGIKRKLPIVRINSRARIASFVILGDTELVIRAAAQLVKRLPRDIDYLMTAEAKGIPLAQEMSRILGLEHYINARKSKKAYMHDPLQVSVSSITTHEKQELFLDKPDAARIKGGRVVLIDDVISSGESLEGLELLAQKAGAQIIGKAAILAEGDAAKRDDIIYLEALPLFN